MISYSLTSDENGEVKLGTSDIRYEDDSVQVNERMNETVHCEDGHLKALPKGSELERSFKSEEATSSHATAPQLSSKDDIRVLDLLPGSGSEEIKCQLRIVSLESPGEYETLSYIWGNPEVKVSIKADGHDHLVTPNLRDALEQIRHATQPRTLWIEFLVPALVVVMRTSTWAAKH
jgi:Heterokaryon incompatibility protein (HET)